MPHIERIREMSHDELRRLLQNSFRILSDPKDIRRRDAESIRDVISREFHRSVNANEWFPWPSTDAPLGRRGAEINAEDWPPEGMLSWLGYRVGKTNPTPRAQREVILDYVFESELPPLNSHEYFAQWGEPATPKRLSKIAETIAAFVRLAKGRIDPRLGRAISDWEEDLKYLYDKYYVDQFGFDFMWPSTDLL